MKQSLIEKLSRDERSRFMRMRIKTTILQLPRKWHLRPPTRGEALINFLVLPDYAGKQTNKSILTS
jgi:hypothetical protein